ncbi:hypothetical protein CCACVL1_10497 [Corchorus capsularis]|uniref:Uncharacterized protein n=1 Tax=Corchorus capsularis TaxID=210143 RepID=A0A1R3IR14_COCAP|nr:hypothetical protein CCACVL1_10497 [Corchorus capsularis]
MYRSKKIDDPGQVISDHRHLVESGDRNIYNLSQLPMLQSYNHHQGDSSSSFRYGDIPSWSGRECLMRNPYTSRSLIDEPIRPGSGLLHGTVTERIFGSNNTSSNNWSNYSFRSMGSHASPFSSLPGWKTHELMKNEFPVTHNLESFQTQIPNPITQTQPKVEEPISLISRSSINIGSSSDTSKSNAVKRKTSDCDLDLDLSLRLTQVKEDGGGGGGGRSSKEDVDHVDSELSLSLFSSPPSSSSSKLSRLKGSEEHSKESARRVSTLDLTI